MTVRDLKHKVYSLARLPINESDALFNSMLGFAIDKIRTELLISEEKRLYITPYRPTVSVPRLVHYSGEEKSLPISGRAYSLGVVGKGYFTVRDGYDILRYDFDTNMSRFRGFIKNGGEICFCGDYTYTVVDFVCFSEITSDKESDIPDGTSERYINLTDEGILRVLSHPTDIEGNPIKDARIIGELLAIPSDFSGVVKLEAIKLSREYTSDEDEVDLPSGYSSLLPPLVASLFFCDDDEELAEKCEKIYENLKKELNLLTRPHAITMVQTNGWA